MLILEAEEPCRLSGGLVEDAPASGWWFSGGRAIRRPSITCLSVSVGLAGSAAEEDMREGAGAVVDDSGAGWGSFLVVSP